MGSTGRIVTAKRLDPRMRDANASAMIPTQDHVIMLCTAPNEEVATKLARGLVAQRLAACVNIVGSVRSFYIWKDETNEEDEIQLVVKTNRDRIDAVSRFLEANHPYEVPEIIVVPMVQGHPRYLAWVDEQTRPR